MFNKINSTQQSIWTFICFACIPQILLSTATAQTYYTGNRQRIQEIPKRDSNLQHSTRRTKIHRDRGVVWTNYLQEQDAETQPPQEADEVTPVTLIPPVVVIKENELQITLGFSGLAGFDPTLSDDDFHLQRINGIEGLSQKVPVTFQKFNERIVVRTTGQVLRGEYQLTLTQSKFLGTGLIPISDHVIRNIVVEQDINPRTTFDEQNENIRAALSNITIGDFDILLNENGNNNEPVPITTFNTRNISSQNITLTATFSSSIGSIVGAGRVVNYYLVVGNQKRLIKSPSTETQTNNGVITSFSIDDLSWLSTFDGVKTSAKLVVEVGTSPLSRIESNVKDINIDTTPPRVVSHRPFIEDSSLHVEILFAEADTNQIGSIDIKRYNVDGSQESMLDSNSQGFTTISVNDRRLVFDTGQTSSGSYQMELKDVADNLGNVTSEIVLPISLGSNVVQNLSPAVEFPEYAPGKTVEGERRRFNPADFVETRVARLFYFRDAHRVAQIINRVTQSYNRAAVSQAEQRYEDAKNVFDELVIDRKTKESKAIRLAQDTRVEERKLEELYQLQNSLRREQASRPTDPTITNFEQSRRNATAEAGLQDQLFDYQNDITEIDLELELTNERLKKLADLEQTDATQLQIQGVEDRKLALERRKFRIEREIVRSNRQLEILQTDLRLRDPLTSVDQIENLDIVKIQSQIDTQESVVQASRSAEADARESVQQAVLNEELAAKRKFELLATARNRDPDTYAPGNINSIDPVARVSVSVIGEGMIQLRGPLTGINKIRLMMHQIDSPRGQVKVDVNTVQINGEDRRRMERVAGNVEANIALGRHLTMQSLELLRRAIVEEATRVAQSSCGVGASQYDRDQKYLYAFFGEDFINELYAMDSEFLRSENKILSLHSMDVVSPSNALFIFLLARNDVQQNICNTFFHLVESELPQIEWEHRSALEIFPHQTRHHLPFSNRNKINKNTQTRVYRNAIQRYKFRNFKTFFQSHSFGQDVLNPTQREFIRLAQIFKSQMIAEQEVKQRVVERALIEDDVLEDIEEESKFQEELRQKLFDALKEIPTKLKTLQDGVDTIETEGIEKLTNAGFQVQFMSQEAKQAIAIAEELVRNANFKLDEKDSDNVSNNERIFQKLTYLKQMLKSAFFKESNPYFKTELQNLYGKASKIESQLIASRNSVNKAIEYRNLLKKYRSDNNSRKLLDFLIEEKLEKQIELLEGTRAQISVMDNYIKRLMTALEDDFQTQFYDPSFIRMRSAASREVVNFSQSERTTLLMNNRDLGIVQPSATMEFDLPRRDILIVETLDTAKAIAQDYGALLQDPTYLAVFDMLGGGQVPNKTQKVLPGLPSLTDEYSLGLSDSQDGSAGSVLQSRVQDPAIYQFETGTGFEVRPVIQPDGHSLVYDFHYMYTSNVREPVRADEKHLGRVKRHFINTQVQTSSFEMREVGRYLVALKAARTGSGVPGLQDIPIVGRAFKPAPSAESSLQQNIVLAKSTVYPTLYDLMGLRWARQVVDLDHTNLKNDDYVVRERRRSLEHHVFDKTGALVDEVLGIDKNSYHYRPDVYHPQENPRNYQHPNGYYDRDVEMLNSDPRTRHYLPQENRQTYGNHSGDIYHQPPMNQHAHPQHQDSYLDQGYEQGLSNHGEVFGDQYYHPPNGYYEYAPGPGQILQRNAPSYPPGPVNGMTDQIESINPLQEDGSSGDLPPANSNNNGVDQELQNSPTLNGGAMRWRSDRRINSAKRVRQNRQSYR